jgi:hypothetical protein
MAKRKTDVIRPHQPGQAAFRSILPEDIEWLPFPAFPPAAKRNVAIVTSPDLDRTASLA